MTKINTTGGVVDFASMPNMPATDKQRTYIATLMDKLGWHSGQIAAYATEQRCDLVRMTVPEASAFIEGLKCLAEECGPGSIGMQASATAVMDIPRLGGALASEAYPSLFDEPMPVRPIRLVRVVCAVCAAETNISFLADGKLCDPCRMDLPLAAANIAADLGKAEQACAVANEAWLAAHVAATPVNQDRYASAVEFRRSLHLNGKLYTEAQADAALQKAIATGDGLSRLLQADAHRRAMDYNLNKVRTWAAFAEEELRAAGWTATRAMLGKTE